MPIQVTMPHKTRHVQDTVPHHFRLVNSEPYGAVAMRYTDSAKTPKVTFKLISITLLLVAQDMQFSPLCEKKQRAVPPGARPDYTTAAMNSDGITRHGGSLVARSRAKIISF